MRASLPARRFSSAGERASRAPAVRDLLSGPAAGVDAGGGDDNNVREEDLMTFLIRGNDKPLGFEILGVDLSQELDRETVTRIEQAIVEHSVVVIRDQKLTPAQHVAFSRRLGEPAIHTNKNYLLAEHPEIYIVSNIVENGRNIGVADAGPTWHSDFSYLAAPAKYSLLYAIEVPVIDGVARGDTSFASTFAAYDALPENRKHELAGLRIVYGYGGQYEKRRQSGSKLVPLMEEEKTPDVAHPVIRTHPISGRKSIFVSDGTSVGVQGMSEDEGRQLVRELVEHCTQPEFVYRHQWRAGDLVIWDNCSSLHRANSKDYELPYRRRMHRTTLAGSVPS
ncbi:MAG: TauD/TfdA family dioxygenase [Betaproteobacteria bacterium]|nr:TauD/TfdA family dioxygenase [Betaproteobacteria bacterium]